MRMDDAGLLKLSLSVSTLGLILLFSASSASQVPTVGISEIDFDDVGSTLSIEGRITSRRVHENGHIFLKVEDDTGILSIVVFSSIAQNLDTTILACLEGGERIKVTGTVEEYRGALEVVPREGDGLRCSTS